MNFGLLRDRITLMQRSDSPAKVGPDLTTYTDLATVWAEVRPVKYLKAAIYASLSIDASAEVLIRRYEGLTVAHRVRFEGRIYSITDIASDRKGGTMTLLLKSVGKVDR